ncbi:hypothetical protein BH09SUM1_BH09SUM1_06110 [soil metagenome]
MTSMLSSKTGKRALLGVAALMLATVVSGCGGGYPKAPVVPPIGLIYTHVQAPLDTDFSGDKGGTDTTDLRMGQAEASYFYVPFTYGLLSFAWGDASIKTAAQDGHLSNVHFADYEEFNILGIYANMKTHTYGK